MASVEKRRYYVDPTTGCECSKNVPGAQVREASCYRIRYRSGGKLRSVKGTRDFRESQKMAAALEAKAWQQDLPPAPLDPRVTALITKLAEGQVLILTGMAAICERLDAFQRAEVRRALGPLRLSG
jgi:hypothetical protein